MKIKFIITKYIRKAVSEKFQYLTAVKPVKELNNPPTKALAVSVSGYFHDFFNVGIAAEKSLKIANTIAMTGCFVIAQRISANAENNPHK